MIVIEQGPDGKNAMDAEKEARLARSVLDLTVALEKMHVSVMDLLEISKAQNKRIKALEEAMGVDQKLRLDSWVN